jgi:hypothetical protein
MTEARGISSRREQERYSSHISLRCRRSVYALVPRTVGPEGQVSLPPPRQRVPARAPLACGPILPTQLVLTISGPSYQLRGVDGSPAYPPPQHASSSRPSSPRPRPVALWSRALPSRCCAYKTFVPRPGRREAFLLLLPPRRRFRTLLLACSRLCSRSLLASAAASVPSLRLLPSMDEEIGADARQVLITRPMARPRSFSP